MHVKLFLSTAVYLLLLPALMSVHAATLTLVSGEVMADGRTMRLVFSAPLPAKHGMPDWRNSFNAHPAQLSNGSPIELVGVWTTNSEFSTNDGDTETVNPGNISNGIYYLAYTFVDDRGNEGHPSRTIQTEINTLPTRTNRNPTQAITMQLIGDGGHFIRATVEGLRAYPNDLYRAEFFFGHAAHTIQDSFSEAHTRRTNQYHLAYQICTYGISAPGVCHHGQIGLIPFDPHDNVWELGGGCRIKKTYDCLKPTAQAATLATTGYLLMLNELVKNHVTPELAPAFINRYFDEPELYGGYLSCNSL